MKRTPGSLLALACASTLLLATTCGSTDRVVSSSVPKDSVNYPRVVGDDWLSYNSHSDLVKTKYFWWFDSRNVYDFVDVIDDPLWGRVARITFPANTGEPGSSPRLTKDLPAPLDVMWYRFRMKYAPGWTDAGPDPAGSANSYKIAFWTWSGFNGRGELQLTNTQDYGTGIGVAVGETYQNYSEKLMPSSDPDFGQITTEWTDGEWWEFVIHYHRTGTQTAHYAYWRRRLTTGGKIAPGAWKFHGIEVAGANTPRVTNVELGCNKNKNNPMTMYIYWGPWEVVDGTRTSNPFGVPHAD